MFLLVAVSTQSRSHNIDTELLSMDLSVATDIHVTMNNFWSH